MDISISIIHPSRGRCAMATQTAQKWMQNTKHTNQIEYWFACDSDDTQFDMYQNSIQTMGLRANFSRNKSAIDAINRVAPLTKGNLIVVVSDDFDTFYGWDDFLLNSLSGKKDYLVKTSDGYMNNNWLITLPIMDRFYYNRFGYIYHPEYKHMFCDTEMTCVGNMLGKVVDLQNPSAIFQHNHYSIGKMNKDEINVKNDSTWNQGKELFLSRHDMNFGLKPEEVIMTYPKEMFL